MCVCVCFESLSFRILPAFPLLIKKRGVDSVSLLLEKAALDGLVTHFSLDVLNHITMPGAKFGQIYRILQMDTDTDAGNVRRLEVCIQQAGQVEAVFTGDSVSWPVHCASKPTQLPDLCRSQRSTFLLASFRFAALVFPDQGPWWPHGSIQRVGRVQQIIGPTIEAQSSVSSVLLESAFV